MNELVDVLILIHRDLVAITFILVAFVLFKDCHGHSTQIVEKLRDIQSSIELMIRNRR